MRKSVKVLRIAFHHHANEVSGPTLLEAFRYMGLVHNVSESENPTVHPDGQPWVSTVFSVRPPHNVDKDVWLRQNVDRLESFGVSASVVNDW